MSTILALESSCDETAAAVVADGVCVLSNIVASQHDLHEPYGGVVPEIAGRAHLERLVPVVERALSEAGVRFDDLDAVAVGHRPGLIGSLLIGVSAAQSLAWFLGVPLLGVDHVLAHLYAPVMDAVGGKEGEPGRSTESGGGREVIDRIDSVYPALGLVVSGGHTTIYLAHGPLEAEILGRTIDDAAGEAFDKAAVTLGLPYPGGPNLDRLAQTATRELEPALPRGLLGPDNPDCSFSGLKTSLLYRVRGQPVGRGRSARFVRDHRDHEPADLAVLARGFQDAVVDTLIRKLQQARERLAGEAVRVRSILAGGGVVANSALRKALSDLGRSTDLRVLIPPMGLCVDNAAMIGGLAWHRLRKGESDPLDLRAMATTSLSESRGPRPR